MADIGSASTTGASFTPDVRRRNVPLTDRATTSPALAEAEDAKKKRQVCRPRRPPSFFCCFVLFSWLTPLYSVQLISLRSLRVGTSDCADSFDGSFYVYPHVSNWPLQHCDLGRSPVRAIPSLSFDDLAAYKDI
jgi:hypothetical protein